MKTTSEKSQQLKAKKSKRWTNEEDEVLKLSVLELLEEMKCLKYFNRTFELPKYFPWITVSEKLSRNSKQCRERYLNHLKPGINPLPWTDEEDDILKLLIKKYPCKWKLLTAYLPGRTENSIKLRWRYFERLEKSRIM